MSRRKPKRRNPWPNPSRRGLVVAGAVVLVGTAIAIAYLREPKAEPIPQGPIPQPKPDHPPPLLMPTTLSPKVTMASGVRYGTSVSIAVPEGGESYDVVVRGLVVGESVDFAIEARVSTGARFTDAGENCLGISLRSRVAMTPDGGIVLSRIREDAPALCQETQPWPVAPAVAIDFDGMELVVRIDAPPLDAAYDMTVALTITETVA